MENLYLIYESLAIRMSAILILVMAIKLIFKNKLSAKAHFMMWLLPLIQLIFCIGSIEIQTTTSIYTALPSPHPAPAQLNFKPVLCGTWLGVTAMLALWHIVSYVIYMRKIRTLPVTDTPHLPKLRRLLGISERRRLTLRTGASAQTVSGTIILPESFDDEEKYHILLHELCHFAHYDNAKLWIALAIVCINWFNPIVWAAFKLFCTDIEMLCDERVLKITDRKREYAQVLVKSSAIRSGFVPGAVSAAGGRRAVFARIRRIVNFRRMKPVWLIAAVLGCGIIAAVCLTVPRKDDYVRMPRYPSPTHSPATAAPEIVIAQNPEAEEQISVEENATAPTDIVIEIPTSAPAPDNSSSRPKPVRENPPVRERANVQISEEVIAPEVPADGTIVVWETPSDGERESVSGNGTKETYRLDDGSQAVVQYDGGEVTNRYIIVE